jgi:hypothetical protein
VNFRDLHLAVEERHVGARQLVPHLDGEGDGAGVGRPLLFGDAVAAPQVVCILSPAAVSSVWQSNFTGGEPGTVYST